MARKVLYFSRQSRHMDRLWFHQCIHGLLSLSTSALRDIHVFSMAHPYQQNIRMAEAFLEHETSSPGPGINGAYHLPDRRALYHLKSSDSVSQDLAHLQAELTDPDHLETSSSVVRISNEGTPDPASQRLRRLLPVYVRPEPETFIAVDDQEDNWAQLEQLLNDNAREEPEDEVFPQASGGFDSPGDPPRRPSLLDRLDLRIDDHAFGQPERTEPSPGRGFTEWLSGLSTFPADHKEKADRAETAHEDEHTGEKGKKKSRKARKEAKRLAKLSVKRKKVVATQTLAELLAKQGHIADAIDMFERLCLLYPEKKAIFAARIETIKSSLP